ncbi:hypothetical protein [Actinoplanes sp. NBRC 103695]|uniref:hypothetical protein n=1 Tax=Actinoplanes sp. NBRC 103695 TaxID=3032202 RepID=UPI002552F6EA|nr:hypothetical protein [Actinoplanes sp. NBRC 103695]
MISLFGARAQDRRGLCAQDSVELHLLQLVGDHYIPSDVVRAGETLASDEPFPFRIEAASLLHRRRPD